MNAELSEVLRAEVGQFMVLPMRPEILDRIQFRRIAMEEIPATGVPAAATKSYTSRLRWPGNPSQTTSSLPGM